MVDLRGRICYLVFTQTSTTRFCGDNPLAALGHTIVAISYLWTYIF